MGAFKIGVQFHRECRLEMHNHTDLFDIEKMR